MIANTTIEPVVRRGETPQEIMVTTPQAEIIEIRRLLQSEQLQTGKTAIITKTSTQALDLQKRLANYEISIPVINDNNENFSNSNIIICPLVLSKGLEFDTVIAVQTESDNYAGALGNHQLFVIATRALHRLYFLRRDFADESTTNRYSSD